MFDLDSLFRLIPFFPFCLSQGPEAVEYGKKKTKRLPVTLYLVNTGSSQYFFWSPNTWTMFLRKPREKPFLSEPVRKTGALKASAKREHQRTEEAKKFSLNAADSLRNRLSQKVFLIYFFTYGGPVFSNQPQMVAEQRQDADAEHRRHEKQEQDVEFGVSVQQLVLAEETGGEQRQKSVTY